LIGTELDAVERAALKILDGNIKKGMIPEKWDGLTAERIVDIIDKSN